MFKFTNEQGDINVEVGADGDVAPTEIQTLLELGVVHWRKKIGLDN